MPDSMGGIFLFSAQIRADFVLHSLIPVSRYKYFSPRRGKGWISPWEGLPNYLRYFL